MDLGQRICTVVPDSGPFLQKKRFAAKPAEVLLGLLLTTADTSRLLPFQITPLYLCGVASPSLVLFTEHCMFLCIINVIFYYIDSCYQYRESPLIHILTR